MRGKSESLINHPLFRRLERVSIPTPAKYLIAAFFSLVIGLNIAHRCDSPPYGYPLNELSDNYWGVIVDIAHRWRSFDLGFWSRSVGGGLSLFTTGLYPILNPTNFFAWFLSDDHFYLFKLIEPYVIGVFLTAVLLWDEFKTKWYIAFFGGLAYMGLALSKSTTIAESPYFLYACGLFPGMVLAFLKLSRRHIVLAGVGVGALLALQFLGEGSTQTPQMLTWWTILFGVHTFSEWRRRRQAAVIREGAGGWAALIALSIGLCAVQLLPSLYYFRHDSARLSGHYSVNNFNFFNTEGGYGLLEIIWGGLLNSSQVRGKFLFVVCLIALALSLKNFGKTFRETPHKKILKCLWLTLLIYFSLPNAAGWLVQFFSALAPVFSPLTYFTFKYGLYTLDFAIVLTVCLVLNNEALSMSSKGKRTWRDTAGWTILCLALAAGTLPFVVELFKDPLGWVRSMPVTHYFVPENLKNARKFLVTVLPLVLLFSLRPRHWVFHLVLAATLLGAGFMMTLDCFKWYGKGQRGDAALFQLGSPEQIYYSTRAKGRYLLAYSAEPEWTMGNYNLLYGVQGTAGFFGAPPLRFTKFVHYFDERGRAPSQIVPFKGNQSRFGFFARGVPASLTTYFPADLTLIKKEKSLPWPGFERVIKGDVYDVYERKKPVEPLYTARRLEVVDLFELARKMESPRTETVYMTVKDARSFGLGREDLGSAVEPQISRFSRPRDNEVSFHTMSEKPFYATVPDAYQSGWRVTIDGQRAMVFPAYYLFNGFKVPSGEHQVRMVFVPKWFEIGLVINVLSLFLLIALFMKFWPAKKFN